eukprot:1825489-Pleurochrysis_carterae.AAC.8
MGRAWALKHASPLFATHVYGVARVCALFRTAAELAFNTRPASRSRAPLWQTASQAATTSRCEQATASMCEWAGGIFGADIYGDFFSITLMGSTVMNCIADGSRRGVRASAGRCSLRRDSLIGDCQETEPVSP